MHLFTSKPFLASNNKNNGRSYRCTSPHPSDDEASVTSITEDITEDTDGDGMEEMMMELI
jgi:hypothetical protein